MFLKLWTAFLLSVEIASNLEKHFGPISYKLSNNHKNNKMQNKS